MHQRFPVHRPSVDIFAFQSGHSAAEEGVEVVVPILVAAGIGHFTGLLGLLQIGVGILGPLVEGDGQLDLGTCTEDGDGGGVAGLELPQGGLRVELPSTR